MAGNGPSRIFAGAGHGEGKTRGKYRGGLYRRSPGDGGLFDIFRNLWGTPRSESDDEMGDFIDQFGEPQSNRRRQRMSDELKKVRERR